MIRPVSILLCAGAFFAACTPVESVAPAPVRSRGPLPEMSIYEVDARWESHGGDTLQLASLRGQPVLLAMTFTNCASACPLIVRDMQEMASSASDATRQGMRFVLVSLDPERDTPAAMRGFAEMHGLGENWTLLRGSPEDVQVLAALLDVRFRPQAGGQISHSNVIHALDADGVVVAQQQGLGADPGPAIAALEEALATNL